MLVQLKVTNYALIDEMTLDFSSGFNVLTGETGAGKSIIVDTVMLILGARARVEDIKKGREHALVEATFELKEDSPTSVILHELGFSGDEGLVLTRELQNTGKNRCRINHRVVTLNDFKHVAESLINIYGQHDYQAITKREGQLALLDSLGDMAYQTLKVEVKDAYQRLQKLARILKKELTIKKNEGERIDYLERELAELEPYQLKRGEEEENQSKFHRMMHIQSLKEASDEVIYSLYSADDSCYSKLFQSIGRLEGVMKKDKRLERYLAPLEEAMIIVDEIAKELSFYKEGLELDDESYKKIEERIGLYDRLRRRYKMSVDDLLDEMSSWEDELMTLQESDLTLERIKASYVKEKASYEVLAKRLSEERKRLARLFEGRLLEQLKDLSMEKARFKVAFLEKKPSADGMDDILFKIAPNPGGELRPLEEIASGGEMSRIMLAFKTILTQKGQIETIIFDEVDTGIGGLILTQVADKLEMVSKYQQVLCVTHAPVIAGRADRHFYIKKTAEIDDTVTSVTPLLEEEAVLDELSRMLGGRDTWQLEHAKALRAQKK